MLGSSPSCAFLGYKPRKPHRSGSGAAAATGGVLVLVVAEKRSAFDQLGLQKRRELRQERLRLKPGKVSPAIPVPSHIAKPQYIGGPIFGQEPEIHDSEGITRMRAAGQLAARVRDFSGTLVKPGVTTDEIDRAAHNMIIEAGAYPSPLGYGGFPKSICTSVNECICHGIPDSRPLEEGDIINIDITVYLNGYHGDTSATFLCGDVTTEAKQLVEVTREALEKAIHVCGPNVEFREIGRTINGIADKYKLGLADERFRGHGIGKVFHCVPEIIHCRNNELGRMLVGQTFTIEPVLISPRRYGGARLWPDGWTYVTEYGSLTAQFEHTLSITEDGVEVLTL